MVLNYKKVYSAAMIYAIITGLSFLFIKIALRYSDPFDLLAHRFTAAFIALIIIYKIKGIKLNFNRKRIIKIIPISLLYPLAFFALQTFGLLYISSAEGGILLAVSPIFTLILAETILKEKTTILQKISILITVSGVIYITVKKSTNLDFDNMAGVILMLMCALSISGYIVMARKVTREFSNAEITSMMILISFISYNLLAIGKNIAGGTLTDFFMLLASPSFIIAVLYLGVLSSLVTSLMTNYILSKIEASKMSVFSNLGTVITIIAGAVILKENIYYYHIIGSVLIVCGVLGVNFLDKNALKRRKEIKNAQN